MAISQWRFTSKPLTKVYDISKVESKKNKKRRKVVASLLMGEWVKPKKRHRREFHVAFRGGSGFIPVTSIGRKRMLELYFIDVGQGDAILVQTPKDRRILIDGGRDGKAHDFLKWKYNLKKKSNKILFDAIVMTHPDRDHAKGLVPVLKDKQVIVNSVYHNGIVRFSDKTIGKIVKKNRRRFKLVELYDDLKTLERKKLSSDYKKFLQGVGSAKTRNRNLKVQRLDQFSKKLYEFDAGKLEVKVLGPINVGTTRAEYRDFGDSGKTLNGNSISLMLEYDKCKILLCGDMNEPAEKEFLKYYKNKSLNAHVFKANHHGSQDFTTEFLKEVRPWVSVISSGDDPDYGHPRAVLLGSLGKHSPTKIERPLVFSTEIAATFKRIKKKDFAHMSSKRFHIYEKVIQGVIHVRTDGKKLVLGRVYGNTKLASPENPNGYKWEYYLFDLK